MKIALSANRPNIEGEIDPRFGRCRYFIFVETDTMQHEVEENPNLKAASGAGISTSQFIANKGAEALITGNIGPNAYDVLSTAGIEIYTGVSGKIREVLEIYKCGALKSSAGPTGGMGMGRGKAQAAGMLSRIDQGKIGGLGIHRSEASWRSGGEYRSTLQGERSDDELAHLKDQTEALAEELARIQERIQQIEEEG